jgi:cytosine/creatinine deaminase
LSVVDIAIADGRIVEIAVAMATDAAERNVGGRLVVPGFVESHIHLDKSCILDRCRAEPATLQEAIREVAAAKRAFTVDDISLLRMANRYANAAQIGRAGELAACSTW